MQLKKDWRGVRAKLNNQMITIKFQFMKASLIANPPYNNLKWNKSKMKFWNLKYKWKRRVSKIFMLSNTHTHPRQAESQVLWAKDNLEVDITVMSMITWIKILSRDR
jgi:hypothetical protein